MKKLLLIFFLFCGTLPCYSQDITRQQADQLLNTIRQQGTDTTHIHALLTLAEFNIFKKGELKTDLDSARLFTDQAKAMNSKVKSITAYGYTALVESYLARETKHEDVAKVLNDKAIQILNDAKNYNHLGQAYFQRATYYNPYDDSGSSIVIDLYYKGIAAYKQINNIERQAYGFKRLGEFSSTVKGTMENLEKSLELYKSIHYGAIQEVYDLMAVAYMYDLNIQKALPYALLALKVAEQQKDTTMQLCAINNHIGLLYDKKKDYTNAALYFKKALKTAEYYKDVNTVYFLSNNIINCYIALKSASPAKKLLERLLKKFPITDDNLPLTRIATALFVKIYTLSNDIKTGEIYTERLQQLDERHRSSLNDAKLIDDNTIISKFYLMAKSYQLAAAFLNKSQELVNRSGTAYDRITLITLKFRLDTAQGNYKSAVTHLLKYNITQDSIFNETKAIEFQKQQVQYETEKKDQQIKILQQQGLLQKSRLQHANLIQDVTLGGILVMLIISALIFRIYKHKKAANAIITQKNELLQQLLRGKEWLLKEVHHRVKNNLHTVICLLESQARYLENDALRAIESSQNRIYAMSLIHQKLYQSDDIKTIDMASYIPELIQSLQQSFETDGKIQFHIQVDRVELGLSQAIPLGLILNEAVTNCIKYAFPDERKGDVFVLMSKDGELITLEIIDNGVGIPDNQSEKETGSLGFKLIKGLSDDIHADFTCETEFGTKIIISFRNQDLAEPREPQPASHSVSGTFSDYPRPASGIL